MEGDTDEEETSILSPPFYPGGGNQEVEYKPLAIGPSNDGQKENMVTADPEVPVLQNICWKELGLLVFVWMAFLVLQIPKNYTATCSIWFGVLNLLQERENGNNLFQQGKHEKDWKAFTEKYKFYSSCEIMVEDVRLLTTVCKQSDALNL
ncbi:uncharacterized protein LOC103721536 isoform X4 [Phoenix dactylifera]|uniref:Uncharacterized protein LOC103721536 isoform X4 n=1 Tax=Phoenix dactylifera TaxID=42345 RepID=A0A8B8ZHH6_PHODC|nr:uncharacterized protein LOC103721536 isoform X4 [Phoenix dactylifera]